MSQPSIQPPSYSDILERRQQLYESHWATGEYRPFVFPHDFAQFFILLIALLIKWPRRGLFRFTRYLLLICILYVNFVNLSEVRIYKAANSYVVGLISTWLTIWSAALLLFTDAQGSFKRIERCFEPPETNGKKDDTVTNGSSAKKRRPANKDTNDVKTRRIERSITNDRKEESPRRLPRLKWQPYPDEFGHRLSWVLDLISNLRGPNWSWRIPTLPPFPNPIDTQLEQGKNGAFGALSWTTESTARLRSALFGFLLNYVIVDILKWITVQDPYFWGFVDSPPPPFIVQHFGALAPFITYLYREFSSVLGIFSIMNCIYPLLPLFCLSISALFPKSSQHVALPIEAAWLYPDLFGNPIYSMLDHGLAGAWGIGWHQFFRFGFTAPGYWIPTLIPTSLRQKPAISTGLRYLKPFLAFFLSGLIHCMGSYSRIGPKHHIYRPFLFFALQPVGILLQKTSGKTFLSICPFGVSRPVRRAVNLSFAVAWLLLFAPLFADDFSRSGIWMAEPLPFSLIGNLGLRGDYINTWRNMSVGFRVWEGERWWERGIQIL